MAIAIATAATTLATTGRLIRWLPEAGPRRAVAAVVAVAGLVLVADGAMIAMYLHSGHAWRPLAVIAVAASATRILVGAAVLRHAVARRRVPGGTRALG